MERGFMEKKYSETISSLFIIAIIFFNAFPANTMFQKPAVYPNGLFVQRNDKKIREAICSTYLILESENGRFQCRYNKEHGKLTNVRFYENGSALFSLKNIRGNSVKVSDQGYLVFIAADFSEGYILAFTFYSKEGKMLCTKAYDHPLVSGFSAKGIFFGVGTERKLDVIDISSGVTESYRSAEEFDISDDGSVVAVAYDNGAAIYKSGILKAEYNTGFIYHRGIKISPDGNRAVVGEMKTIHVYSLRTFELIYSENLGKNEFLRELKIDNNTLWAGIKNEDKTVRKGIVKTYTFGNNHISSVQKEVVAIENVKRSGLDIVTFREKYKADDMEHDPIPWPFKPQDEPHKVWNNYEGLNAPSDGEINSWSPYLHQGFDIEVDVNEPCYSVDTGYVKYKGDLGGMGEEYWRIAHSPVNVSGYSTGWLTAHLIKSTINYDVGEKIPEVGLHLGNVIIWQESPVVDAHIHFANIRDHGQTWSYDDDEWGLTYNPETVLRPYPDTIAPVIVTAISGKSKFGYCKNNTGTNANNSNYIYPDSSHGGLTGDIDIVVELYDYIVYENFTQPAYAVYYWIKGIDPVNCWSNYNKLIVDTTLSHIRNQAFDFFWVSNYKPYALVMHKVDNVFVVGGWDTRDKTFAHMLTNNNGDSLVALGEEDSCLHTESYYDGWYRVYAKACDAAGNCVVDSEEVYFNNGNHDPSPVINGKEMPVTRFYLGQNYPCRFTAYTTIQYHIPQLSHVSLLIYDLAGGEVRTLALGMHKKGRYSVRWDGRDNRGVTVGAGIYLYRLIAGDLFVTRKMHYLK
jgi:hypothetical protein